MRAGAVDTPAFSEQLARDCFLVRSLGKIFLYLTVVVLIGALLSPPIYWLVQWLGSHDILAWLARFPFHRFFSRTVQVSAFVLLVPLLFWLRIRRLGEFGLEKNPHPWRDLGVGLALAFLPVAGLAVGYLWTDAYRIRPDLSMAPLFRIATSAGVVAVLEEFLFRGVLLGLAVRALGRWPAALAVSVAFAAVHFLKPGKKDVAEVTWGSGFAQIAAVWDGLPSALQLGFGFLSLVLAGLILAGAALRTQSLWLPIGLHAGWILGQQGIQWLAKYRIKPPEAWLPWVGPNVVSGAVPTGLVPAFVLLLTGLAVWLYIRYVTAPRRTSGS